ncbi:MAG: hypothetical protein QF685_03805 [Verrucomicrobiota bacterium]|nr:hypothetical protein [Verrucomicrobiota bacterium]
MRLFWSSAGLFVWVLAGGVWAQTAPVRAVAYQDQNVILAVVGSRMVTKWEVMRSLERRDEGFIERFNTLNQGVANLYKQLEVSRLDGQKEKATRLEFQLREVEKAIESALRSLRNEQAKQINDQLLIEQVKADPLFREPPGLVDYFLARRVKAKKDGLTGIIRDLQSDGRTMAMLREEILDDWILRRVERELDQQVIVSPKQVRDRYQTEYASDAGRQFNVADLYLMRMDWDKERVKELGKKVEQMVKDVRSREDFIKLCEVSGAEGDGPQGLIPFNDGTVGTLDRKRKGSPLPGTPVIHALPTIERTGILRDAYFKRLMAKVAGMARGEVLSFHPLGGRHVFILYVNDVIRGYTIPLVDLREKIHDELFDEARRELRRRKIVEARKAVFVDDYLEEGDVSLINLPAPARTAGAPPPPVSAPKP